MNDGFFRVLSLDDLGPGQAMRVAAGAGGDDLKGVAWEGGLHIVYDAALQEGAQVVTLFCVLADEVNWKLSKGAVYGFFQPINIDGVIDVSNDVSFVAASYQALMKGGQGVSWRRNDG